MVNLREVEAWVEGFLYPLLKFQWSLRHTGEAGHYWICSRYGIAVVYETYFDVSEKHFFVKIHNGTVETKEKLEEQINGYAGDKFQ